MKYNLVLSTSNEGKRREWSHFLAEFPLVHAPAIEVVEDCTTYAANAVKKAQEAALAFRSHYPDSLFLAEDAGIEVPSLNNLPAVHSARFASCLLSPDLVLTPPPGDELPHPDQNRQNNNLLLALLRERHLFIQHGGGVPARFRAVIAICNGDGKVIDILEGELPVEVVEETHYDNGFGYDAITRSPRYGHMGLLSVEQKNTFSHRALALRSLARRLADFS